MAGCPAGSAHSRVPLDDGHLLHHGLTELGVDNNRNVRCHPVAEREPVAEASLFQKLLTDWSTGTNSIDVGVFASGWAVELADSGLLADLSDFVANDPDIMFDDIAPYFREFNQKIDGRTYLITVDGDFHMLYYRTDVLEKNGLEC